MQNLSPQMSESVVSKHNIIIECTICMEVFNTEDRKPMLLECTHNLCKSCLQVLIEKATQNDEIFLLCPSCRHRSLIE